MAKNKKLTRRGSLTTFNKDKQIYYEKIQYEKQQFIKFNFDFNMISESKTVCNWRESIRNHNKLLSGSFIIQDAYGYQINSELSRLKETGHHNDEIFKSIKTRLEQELEARISSYQKIKLAMETIARSYRVKNYNQRNLKIS